MRKLRQLFVCNIVNRIISVALLVTCYNYLSLPYAQADVLISLEPSQQALDGIEPNLLKAYNTLGKKVPEWLNQVDFSFRNLHVSIGYIDENEWAKNSKKITKIINLSIDAFKKARGELFFTFGDIGKIGHSSSSFVSIFPDHVTKKNLEKLNRYIHRNLQKNGFQGFINYGKPDVYRPHLSLIKTKVLKTIGQKNWQRRNVTADFNQVLKKFFSSVKKINKIAYCSNPNKPRGYGFRFVKANASALVNGEVTQIYPSVEKPAFGRKPKLPPPVMANPKLNSTKTQILKKSSGKKQYLLSPSEVAQLEAQLQTQLQGKLPNKNLKMPDHLKAFLTDPKFKYKPTEMLDLGMENNFNIVCWLDGAQRSDGSPGKDKPFLDLLNQEFPDVIKEFQKAAIQPGNSLAHSANKKPFDSSVITRLANNNSTAYLEFSNGFPERMAFMRAVYQYCLGKTN